MNARLVEIKRFAVHDGPGIRTTLFLKGCSLACRWCHNPESISPEPQVAFFRTRCTVCRDCQAVCPTSAHTFVGEEHLFDRDRCTRCGKCVEACLPGALQYYGRDITAEAASAEILADRTFYETSGGGATVSGGEPLLQADFCAELFQRLKTDNIHCAVDTCGAAPWSAFEKVIPFTDMFLYDLKHTDDTRHRQFTGGSNVSIIENLNRLSHCDIPIEIRIPLIPGFNDDDADLDAIGTLLAPLANITAVRLLTWHDLARSKYDAVGRPDLMPHTPSLTTETVNAAEVRLRSFALKIIRT